MIAYMYKILMSLSGDSDSEKNIVRMLLTCHRFSYTLDCVAADLWKRLIVICLCQPIAYLLTHVV